MLASLSMRRVMLGLVIGVMNESGVRSTVPDGHAHRISREVCDRTVTCHELTIPLPFRKTRRSQLPDVACPRL